MVMSEGTSTFLACFAAFWSLWALVVLFCCFCSFLQRRLKRRSEQRLREQCLRAVDAETAGYLTPPPSALLPPLQLPAPPPQCCAPPSPRTSSPVLPLTIPHPLPQAAWVSMPDTGVVGKPPCYEEAVLMEDPPPPYSEVLADPRGGTHLKPGPLRTVPPVSEIQDSSAVFTSDIRKLPAQAFPDRGYSSLIRLPSSQRWDSLGHLLSNMDLNHNDITPPGGHFFPPPTAVATMPRQELRTHQNQLGFSSVRPAGMQGFQGGLQGLHRLRGLESTCGLPTAFPLLGRSTAV